MKISHFDFLDHHVFVQYRVVHIILVTKDCNSGKASYVHVITMSFTELLGW